MRRAFIPRELLLGEEIAELSLRPSEIRAFQGWMARFYSRIAMPETLVARLRASGGISSTIKNVLLAPLNRTPCHNGVEAFYVRWDPDRDLAANENYDLQLVIACRDETTEDFLTAEIGDLASGYGSQKSAVF